VPSIRSAPSSWSKLRSSRVRNVLIRSVRPNWSACRRKLTWSRPAPPKTRTSAPDPSIVGMNEALADVGRGGVDRLGRRRGEVVGDRRVVVRRPVELLGLARAQVGDAGLGGDLVDRERRRRGDTAGQEVDLLLLDERLGLAQCDVGLELVVADDQLDGAVAGLAVEELHGQFRAVALLLAELDVGTGEAGDHADLERLGRSAGAVATTATTGDRAPARRDQDRHTCQESRPRPHETHLSPSVVQGPYENGVIHISCVSTHWDPVPL
jgi:hypothetical protein